MKPLHTTQVPPKTSAQFMRVGEVMRSTGAGKSTLYFWMAKGEFPKPRKLGARAVGWLASDVDAWISSRHAA